MSRKPDQLSINFSSRKLKATLNIFSFIDHGHHIAYIPSLNLSYYGDTDKEAREHLINFVLKDFLNHLMSQSNDTVIRYLKELGWDKSKFFNKKFTNVYIDKDGVLKNFDLSEETEVNQTVVSV